MRLAQRFGVEDPLIGHLTVARGKLAPDLDWLRRREHRMHYAPHHNSIV
jgi:hypothetical protein